MVIIIIMVKRYMASPHNQLLLTLSDAASQQPDRIKLAETRLKEWETAPKFYSTLLVSAFIDL